MTDEKKPEEDEVTEEQLEGVAGGATAPNVQQPIVQTKQQDLDTPTLATFVCDGTIPQADLPGSMETTDDED